VTHSQPVVTQGALAARLEEHARQIADALELISAQQAIIADQRQQIDRLRGRVDALESARAAATTLPTLPRVVDERREVQLRVDPRAEPDDGPRPPRQRRPSQQVIAVNLGAAQHAERIREHAAAILDELAEGSRQAVLSDREEP
jgi:uncharacterized coiled-coil protein SlyX